MKKAITCLLLFFIDMAIVWILAFLVPFSVAVYNIILLVIFIGLGLFIRFFYELVKWYNQQVYRQQTENNKQISTIRSSEKKNENEKKVQPVVCEETNPGAIQDTVVDKASDIKTNKSLTDNKPAKNTKDSRKTKNIDDPKVWIELLHEMAEELRLPECFERIPAFTQEFSPLDSVDPQDGMEGDIADFVWLDYKGDNLDADIVKLIAWSEKHTREMLHNLWDIEVEIKDVASEDDKKLMKIMQRECFRLKTAIYVDKKPEISDVNLTNCRRHNIMFAKPIGYARYYDFIEDAKYYREEYSYPGSVDDAATYTYVSWEKCE